ncbi:MAG: redox-sensing transcriptional repressor Rex [Elusimicrobiota bacterium]
MLNKFIVERLILYNRICKDFSKAGKKWVTSRDIAEVLSKTSAQVRRDLSKLGKKGKPGVGYKIDELVMEINKLLGLDRHWNIVLVGAGNLGRALFFYPGFKREGFNFKMIVDSNPDKIGEKWKGIEITPVANLVQDINKKDIDIAIIAVPSASAQEVCDKVVRAGIREILNFAPCNLNVSDDVEIRYADLALELQNLSYTLKSRKNR